MARTLKGIRDNLEAMKKSDNAWADRYVRDVSWLLNRFAEKEAEIEKLKRGEYICSRCHHRQDAEQEGGAQSEAQF